MTLSSAAALFGSLFVLAIIPAPSVFAVVARTITSGFIHGLLTVIGIVAGDLVFILLAVLGLSVVADTMGGLFTVVKIVGAAYLIWLGLGLWRSRDRPAEPAPSKSTESQTAEGVNVQSSAWLSDVLSGLLITLGDPRAIFFYIGFFPAFLDLSKVSIMDVGIVMIMAAIAVGGAKLSYAYMADKARRLLKRPQAQKGLNIMASAVMIGTGLFILVNT